VTPAAPAMQREAVRLSVEPILAMARIRGLGSTAGNEGWKAFAVALLRPPAGRPPAIGLLLARLMLMIRLGLAAGKMLLARVGLLLARRVMLSLRFTAERRIPPLLLLGIVESLFARLPFRTEERLGLPELLLSRGDQAEIVLRMLIIILGGDGIARCLGIASELDVFFGDMGSRSADFHVRTVRFVDPGQRILAFAVAPAHAFVLTVSHGSSFFDSLLWRSPAYPRFPGTHAKSTRLLAAAGRRKSVLRTSR